MLRPALVRGDAVDLAPGERDINLFYEATTPAEDAIAALRRGEEVTLIFKLPNRDSPDSELPEPPAENDTVRVLLDEDATLRVVAVLQRMNYGGRGAARSGEMTVVLEPAA